MRRELNDPVKFVKTTTSVDKKMKNTQMEVRELVKNAESKGIITSNDRLIITGVTDVLCRWRETFTCFSSRGSISLPSV